MICIGKYHLTCKRGEWITTYKELAEKAGITKGAVGRILQQLVKAGKITVESLDKFTIIRVCNYNSLTFYSSPPPEDPTGRPAVAAPASLYPRMIPEA